MRIVPSFDEVMTLTRTVSSIILMQDDEARVLYNALCTVPENGLVVEVGCQMGRSSSLIAQMAQAMNFRSVHVDPYKEQPEFMVEWAKLMRFIGGEDEHRFTFLCGRTDQMRWEIGKLCADRIDVAYIDGDHEEPAVQIDLDVVASRVKSGGYLVCHDYGAEPQPFDAPPLERFPAVSRLLDAYTAEGWERVALAHTMGAWRRM